MAKRILSIALALLLLMNVFVVAVSAEGEADYNGAFKLSTSTTLPKRGDVVKVTVSAQTDYPASIIAAIIVYDSTYYEIVGSGKSAFTILQSSWPVDVTAVTTSPAAQYHPSYDSAMKARYKLAYISLLFNPVIADEGGDYITPVLSDMTDFASFDLRVKDDALEDGRGIVWIDPVFESSATYKNRNATKLSRGAETLAGGTIEGFGQTLDYSQAILFEPGEEPQIGDYTEVNAAIARKPADYPGAYTAESVAAVEDAINAVNWDLEDSEQETIDGYAAAINAAIDALVAKPGAADYEAVNAAIARKPADLSLYTAESVAAVEDAIEAVNWELDETQQATVDGYAAAINAAIDALVVKPGAANYNVVNIAIANKPADYPAFYTDDSVAAVEDAINAVDWDLDETRQAEVDAFAAAINAAIDALAYKAADYSNVNKAKARIPADFPDAYTLETAIILEDALVLVVEGLDIREQAQVDAFAAAINAAIDALVRIVAPADADYTAVGAAIARIPADLSVYTPESVAAVNDAVAAVVYDLDETRQAEVDAFAAAINLAVDGLILKPVETDKTALQALIDDAKLIDTSVYTSASVEELSAKITAAEDVVAQEDATQVDVDNALIALQTAIDGLVAKNPADYYELTRVLDYFYPRDDMLASGIYNDAEIEALQELLASYNMNLPSTAQDTVDGYVAELKAAIAALTIDETKAVASFDIDTDLTYAREGDSVKVSVKLKTNYPIYTMMIPVIYDGTVFQMENTTGPVKNAFLTFEGQLATAMTTNGNWDASATILQSGNSNTSYWNSAENKVKYKIAYATWTADFSNKSPVCLKLDEFETIVSFSMKVKADVPADTVSEILMHPDFIKTATFAPGKLAVARGVGTYGSAITSTPPAHVDVGQTIDFSLATASVVVNTSGADYSAVDAAIAAANEMNLANYTDETVAALSAAIEAVVRDLSSDEQETVDGFAAAISAAIDALVLKRADYTAVDEAIQEVDALDLSKYTDESVGVLNDVIDAVVRDLGADEQATVDAFAAAINAAIDALVLKTADYTAVEEAVARIPADLTIYTDESVAAVNTAVAGIIHGLEITRQAEVDAMAAALNAAIDALVLKPVPADYTAVEAAIARIPADLTVYTPESVAAVNDAVAAVVYDLDDTKQAEVDAFAAAINAAIDALVLKTADYTAVDEAVQYVDELDLSIYTEESVAALNAAIEAIVRDFDVTNQAEVDAMAAAINAAIDALVLKPVPADYTAVEAAIARIPADLTVYTPESVAAVNDAVAAVVYDLDDTKQAEVDAMAAAINAAIDALVLIEQTEVWGEWVVVKVATCTEAGLERRTSNLGNTQERAIAALGHNWSDWVSNDDAKFFVNGTETRTCSICGDTETRVEQGSAGYFDFIDGNSNWFYNAIIYIVRIIVVALTWFIRGIEWYI